ncbi:MAG TPA: hypothetical protein VGO43_14905 [Pyrinomonadaceae bacterium]|jgi:hypothetical protein|nr:hypothetical protein [Pyrinomonadaceae bacterium]
MPFSQESAVARAKSDLAARLNISEKEIVESVRERDFPDMVLGAPIAGEMAAQMISSGWQIDLDASGKRYDYRADKYQLRLHNFEGVNYVLD